MSVQTENPHKQNSGLQFLIFGRRFVGVRDRDLPEQCSSQRRTGAHQPAARVRRGAALAFLVVKQSGAGLKHRWKQAVRSYEPNQQRSEVPECEQGYTGNCCPSESRGEPETRKSPKQAVDHRRSRCAKQANVDANRQKQSDDFLNDRYSHFSEKCVLV